MAMSDLPANMDRHRSEPRPPAATLPAIASTPLPPKPADEHPVGTVIFAFERDRRGIHRLPQARQFMIQAPLFWSDLYRDYCYTCLSDKRQEYYILHDDIVGIQTTLTFNTVSL